MTSVGRWVVQFRWPILFTWVLITAFFAAQLPKTSWGPGLEIDPEIKNQLPEEMPARQNLKSIEQRFGGSELVMIVLSAEDVLARSTLERVQKISEGVAKIEGVTRVISPFTLTDIQGGEGGMMSVEAAIPAIPTTDEERVALRERLGKNDLVFGNVLARDFSAVSIIGMLSTDAKDSVTVAGVDAVLADAPGPEAVEIGGMPVVREHVSADIRSDVRRFAPIGMLVIVVLLYGSLREVRGVVLPFLVMISTIIFSVGLMPMLGWKFQIVSVTLPVTILAVGNDHSVHLIARFQEDNVIGNTWSSADITKRGIQELGIPVLAAGITTVAGMLCLLTHIVVPAQQLGVTTGIGLGYAMLVSLTVIPAFLSMMKKPEPSVGATAVEQGGLLERWLGWNARLVTRYPRLVVAAIVVLAMVTWVGIPMIKVDTNPVNYYPSTAPVAKTAMLINEHFGGSTEIAVMIEGDIDEPAVLAKVDEVEQRLSKLDSVGYTMSIARVVRKLNGAVTGNADIPKERAQVAQLLELYSMGGSTADLERMIDPEHQTALVTARLNSLSTQDIQVVVEDIRGFVQSDLGDLKVTVGGFGVVFADLVDAVVQGQLSSLALSMVIVGLINALFFWNMGAGVWSMVPLALGVPMLFGLMGFAGIELNVVTGMLSSVMIGVGVDYTTHFMFRFREERHAGHSPEVAVYRSLVTAGRGIVFNALAVMVGFSVLFLSNFTPVRYFGFLVAVSIAGCLLAALMLMPPLMMLLNPGYARPKE
jgi:uncharacterized protein